MHQTSVQFSSVTQSCLTLCDPMDCSTPGLPVHHQLLEPTQTHVHQVGDAIQHLILCQPLLLPPSIFPSIRVFSNESVVCIRWPKYWSFSFSISLSNEYSELISFRIDWFDLTVQGTLKSLLQYHSSIGLKLREILDVDPDFRMAEVEVAVIAVGAIMSEKWMAKKGVTTRGQGSQLM